MMLSSGQFDIQIIAKCLIKLTTSALQNRDINVDNTKLEANIIIFLFI